MRCGGLQHRGPPEPESLKKKIHTKQGWGQGSALDVMAREHLPIFFQQLKCWYQKLRNVFSQVPEEEGAKEHLLPASPGPAPADAGMQL